MVYTEVSLSQLRKGKTVIKAIVYILLWKNSELVTVYYAAENLQSIPSYANTCQNCLGLICYFCGRDIYLPFDWVFLADI